MKRKRIDLTQADIYRGCPKDAGNCPVALALSRAFPNATHVTVTKNRLSVYDYVNCKQLVDVPTPRRVERFIGMFDCRDVVKPFSFYIEVQP